MKVQEKQKGRKFDQVLEGAREVFLNHGFEAANMDVVAKTAKVSKATLYSYFPDKQTLFIEVTKAECERQAEHALTIIDQSQPIDQVLCQAARYAIKFMISDMSLRIFRICVAEADRFPILSQSFYKNGPLMGREKLVLFFKYAVAHNLLQIENYEIAADQFIDLCKNDIWSKVLFGIQTKFSDDEINCVADAAVGTFLARYGVQQ